MDSAISEPKLREVFAKSIVTKSNLPGVDYVINPYTGCKHSCIYCYAEFMKKYTGHEEPWGDFVDIKVNAPELVGLAGSLKEKTVFLSSVTDPYQPLEAKCQLTRKILERLVEKQPIVDILTKSALVTRDIDIFRKFREITIGVSLSTLSPELSRQLEPFASPPSLRLEAIKKCKEAGLKTWVFLSPIFPGITRMEEIMKEATPYVDYFMFENLNVRPNNRQRVFDFMRKNKPELLPLYRAIYDEGDLSYWKDVEKEIEVLCRKYGRDCQICFHHGGFSGK